MNNNSVFIDLLKNEVVPALGCTEPIAVALAVAKARETLGETPQKIKLLLSANIFKNGMGVGIPGTGMIGLYIASALGAIYGKSANSLEVLAGVTDNVVAQANKFVDGGNITIEVKDTPEKLYIEAICYGANDQWAKAVIVQKHSNIVLVEKNGQVLESAQHHGDTANGNSLENVSLTVEEIFSFVNRVPFTDIEFILDTVSYNEALAHEGLNSEYGLNVGRNLKKYVDKGVLSDDLMNNAMYFTAAASDARMSGSKLPAMSNSGSGNQGITATLPVFVAAKRLGSSKEELARALALSHLIAIHIKTYLGRLSALCGCVVAASGAGCGVAYLMGGGLDAISSTIKNMTGNVTGMICDGAKAGCALKVSSGVNSAIQSALLALEGVVISCNDGIIDEDVEKTIGNLGRIGSEGMNETDELLLDIMVAKNKC